MSNAKRNGLAVPETDGILSNGEGAREMITGVGNGQFMQMHGMGIGVPRASGEVQVCEVPFNTLFVVSTVGVSERPSNGLSLPVHHAFRGMREFVIEQPLELRLPELKGSLRVIVIPWRVGGERVSAYYPRNESSDGVTVTRIDGRSTGSSTHIDASGEN